MKKFALNWIPVLLYASAIFLFSSFPIYISPPSDKVIHFFEYAVMGFFVSRAILLSWDLPKKMGLILGALLAALLGVVDEFHQSFVPGRDASAWDALADALGAVAGACFFIYLGVLLFRSRRLYPMKKCDVLTHNP